VHDSYSIPDYIQKLAGLKIDELVEASEDRETWRELVVACVDPQTSLD